VKNTSGRFRVFLELFLLLCFIFPAGFGFFAVMLELSLPGKTLGLTASALILALTANRVGRMLSATAASVSLFRRYEIIVAGLSQSAALFLIFRGSTLSDPSLLAGGAFFLGIGLAAGNVYFRALLTSGRSHISSVHYAVVFYVLWGLGVAFAGLAWSYSLQGQVILAMLLISLIGTAASQIIFKGLQGHSEGANETIQGRNASAYMRIFSLSVPAAIVSCVAILFNATLIPVLTNKFGFSVAGTGIAAFFIVIGNLFALLGKAKMISGELRRFLTFVLANILLVVFLFALRDYKAAALLIIIGIGWSSTLSLQSQMDFIALKAGPDMHRAIHAVSEIVSVAAGVAFALINKVGIGLLVQFVFITGALLLWARLESNRPVPEETYG